jgi:transcriptional regulator with XRE-family HTH domain
MADSDESLAQAALTAESLTELAYLLRQLRRRHGRVTRSAVLTFRELAAKTGWSQAAVGEYFRGSTLPPIDRLDDLLRLLDATAAELRAFATARDRLEEMRRARAASRGRNRSVGRATGLTAADWR